MSMVRFILQRKPQTLDGNFKPLPIDTSGEYEVLVQCDGICAHYDRIYVTDATGRVNALDRIMDPDDLYENLKSNLSGDEWEYVEAAIRGYDFRYIDVGYDVQTMRNPDVKEDVINILNISLTVKVPTPMLGEDAEDSLIDLLSKAHVIVYYLNGSTEYFYDLGSYIDESNEIDEVDGVTTFVTNVSMTFDKDSDPKKINDLKIVGSEVSITMDSFKVEEDV